MDNHDHSHKYNPLYAWAVRIVATLPFVAMVVDKFLHRFGICIGF